MEEKLYITATELSQITGLKYWRCNVIIKECNKQLEAQGKYTMRNVVSKKAVLAFLGEVEA